MKRSFYVLLAAGLLSLNNFICWAGLIENGSFESLVPGKNPIGNSDPDGIAKWLRYGYENNESSTLFARTGSRSFKGWYTGGIFQDFMESVVPGNVYKASCYMFTPSGGLKGTFYGVIKLEWRDDRGEILYSQTKESERFDSSMPADKWKYVSVQEPAPVAAVKGRITLEFRGEGQGSGVIFWDDADVQEVKPQ